MVFYYIIFISILLALFLSLVFIFFPPCSLSFFVFHSFCVSIGKNRFLVFFSFSLKLAKTRFAVDNVLISNGFIF